MIYIEIIFGNIDDNLDNFMLYIKNVLNGLPFA